MNNEEKLKQYLSIVPSKRQLDMQDTKFYAFIHYGVNTFTDREWGTGKESEAVFNPACQDTDQWCKAIKAAGMQGVILTCKHHDGFCLWPTKTTEHSVKNSPYKNGKGDVVGEVAESCRKYGLKFGVYLSPWDRNSEFYGTDAYNDFYNEQETELLTQYGDIFMLWLDGACDAKSDGKPVQKYDFERIWKTAYDLQPNIVISGCGPDIRWVGNESGIARKNEWNVVPKFKYELQNIAANCQQSDDFEAFQKRCEDVMTDDLGSRSFLANFDEFMWYPAEVNVSIRKGWFFHDSPDNDELKSLDKLMKMYYGAVGGNASFLLNIPPNADGLLHTSDVKRLAELGAELDKIDSLMLKNVHQSDISKTDNGYEFTLDFDECVTDRIRLEEDTRFSQRVEEFKVYSGEREIYCGSVVGMGKIAIFDPIKTNSLRVVITKCRFEPHIKSAYVYKSGGYRIKEQEN